MADTFADLQSYIRHLDRQGELRRVSVDVDPELEITEIATRVVRERGPALLFEHVRGSDFPLAINLFGSERRIELALGRHPAEIGEMLVAFVERLNPPSLGRLWSQRSALRQLLNLRVTRARFRVPVQQLSEEPDLTRLPALKCWPEDGGRFITFPLVLTADPATGRRNLGIYRMQIHDARTTGMHWQIQKGGRFHHWQAERSGRPIEVAVVLGGDPALMLAAAIPLPEALDEVAFSGLLRGRPAALARAKTISLSVPANAEFVLEGLVPPDERRPEGPFGDHFGHYSRQAPFPVFHLQRITRRRNAVYPATVVGAPPQEDKYIGDATQQILSPLVRLVHREVASLWAYHEAGFHNLAVAAVRVRYRREAIKTALSLLGEGQLSLTKCLVLVDADVDPRDFTAVLAAIRRNFGPERDLTVIPRAPVDTLDFSSFQNHLGSKMVLDATSPVEEGVPSYESSTAPDLPGPLRPPSPLSPPDPLPEPLDSRIKEMRVLGGALMVAKVSGDGRELCEKILRSRPPSGVKIVVVVSEDIDLKDQTSLIWGIFTRFDPARDLAFAHSELRGALPIYHGPMGIDATFKEGYPARLQMSEEIRERVSRRWGEYLHG